jgi:hypothetical protein
MKFAVGRNLASKPAWWLVDDDERVLAWAGRTFVTLAYADQAAHDFRVNAGHPEYRFHPRSSGVWRWTAWESEIRVAISMHGFPNEHTAREAAARVREHARRAIGP